MLYVNKRSKMICATIKEVKCPEDIFGVGKSPVTEGMIKFEIDNFLKEDFRRVTTKEFKDSLKSL
ncbi:MULTISPECIES: hypothetical protein [Paenibacillus]|uniref:Uncharacterized protein n=2 Tax=Paenibacillus TaxID=44249 RepID=A0ABX2Z8P6_PAEPO|nr:MULTISPECIES: hypothetical protein [Paenibacillus]MDR6779378.1 putative glycosyltransferase [Paenibacillus peoriae]ODA07684.1 hypothetical protein A7312_28175 [Paenibacillus polymyxa]